MERKKHKRHLIIYGIAFLISLVALYIMFVADSGTGWIIVGLGWLISAISGLVSELRSRCL